jgi:hypothetical protein
MKSNCHLCGRKFLICHEAWPKVRILIDPDTGMPHKCNPSQQIIQDGKWRGYTFKEMAKLWYEKKIADNNP